MSIRPGRSRGSTTPTTTTAGHGPLRDRRRRCSSPPTRRSGSPTMRSPSCWRGRQTSTAVASAAQPRLLSVNVGMPRDVEWEGRTVHTGIWKDPVDGRQIVRRLNIDGDGQGDLAGHGGPNRAVFVYQIESYRYWQEFLARDDLVDGQFGENFTVEGLTDDEVCIGDRYRIGSAVFEVSQPRVTCYRVGIRMNEPQMPSLARRPPAARLLLPRARGGRGPGRRPDRASRARPRGDDRGRYRRPAVSAAPGPARPGPGAPHPRAQPGLAGIVPRTARRPCRGGRGAATGLARLAEARESPRSTARARA